MRCLPAAVLAIFLAAATGLAAGTLDDLETALNNMELRFWTDIYDLGSGRKPPPTGWNAVSGMWSTKANSWICPQRPNSMKQSGSSPT